MAEDKVEPREVNWRQMMPWTTLFQGFRVALDPNKLILAAFGILFMALGWWLLAVIFDYKKPHPNDYTVKPDVTEEDAWKDYKANLQKWYVMYHAAGSAFPNDKERDEDAYGPGDLAKNNTEFTELQNAVGAAKNDPVVIRDQPAPPAVMKPDQIQREVKSVQPDPGYAKAWVLANGIFGNLAKAEADKKKAAEEKQKAAEADNKERGKEAEKKEQDADDQIKEINRRAAVDGPLLVAKVWVIQQHILPPAGAMRTLPWNEDRGPNPFMLITGQAGSQWKEGGFWNWLLFQQIPVLLEPLVKLFSPVVYFFKPEAGSLVRFYALLVMLWTLLVWGFFGGAITRIAAVQVARQEKVGLIDAMRFAARKYTSYLSAPLFPLVLVGLLLVLMILFGYVQMIPILGDLLDLLLWGLMILIGLAMAVVLIGLVGWPLMAATVSAEGTDAWEAVSRSYSYVYQAPWHYIWYTLVALAYGAVIVFFIGLMGSLTVYLSKFGVSQTPGINWRHESNKDRNPTYLFVYAPESFGWRKLLLQDDRLHLVSQGEINEKEYNKYLESFSWANTVSAVIVSIIWVGIIFMLVLGFGYSYFWSAATIIYLLMRRKVDDAELDEVYLEEEDEAAYAGPLAPKPAAPAPAAAAPPAAPGVARPSLPIVEAPSRPIAVSVPPPAPPPPAEPPPPPPPPPAATETSPIAPLAPPPTEPPPPSPDGNSPPVT